MKVDIVQKIINEYSLEDTDIKHISFCDKHTFEEVKGISFCCKAMEALFDDGVVSIEYGYHNDKFMEDAINYDEYNLPFVAINKSNMVNNGDYGYDGEDEYWNDYYEKEFSYYGIKKCPVCGEDIVINLKEVDVTNDLNKVIKMIPIGRKTIGDKEARRSAIEKMNEIVGDKYFS